MAKPRPTPQEITQLLGRWRGGDAAAQEELWPVIYHELKTLARGVLNREGHRGRHGTTTLVHEAFLRLVGSKSEVEWNDRGHFFAIAAHAMRHVLVDEARRRLSKKREGDQHRAELSPEVPSEATDPTTHRPEDVLAIHQALERLALINPRYEKLVEARYFAGFSVDETAELLDVSRPTVVRDWRTVRTWLYSELQNQAS